MIKSMDKDLKQIIAAIKIHGGNFDKCNVAIKSTGFLLKNVTLQ
jgi:hypothetical protein